MTVIGLLFKAATFPGLIFNNVVQNSTADIYDAPRLRLAVGDGPDAEGPDLDAHEETPSPAIRVLAPGEQPAAHEREEQVLDYDGIESFEGLFGVVLIPFFACSVIALGIYIGGLALFGIEGVGLVGIWFGFAIAAHAFPNAEATNALWRRSKHEGGVLRLVGYPTVALSKLVNQLRFLWIDAVYALLLFIVAREGILPLIT